MSSTQNATNITLDSEPTKTSSSKQGKKTDDLKETGQLTWFEVPRIRRWTTPHQDIVIQFNSIQFNYVQTLTAQRPITKLAQARKWEE
jgi:hypothetical protein